MGRMLMVLSADGTIESLVDDGPPFDEVELLDCHKGEAGDVFGVIKDPVLLQWDERGLMKIGIEPSGLGNACDQRAMVHYQDLGCTEVSYTPNGVAVRIYDDSGSPPVFEWQIYAEDLLAWRDGAAHRNG